METSDHLPLYDMKGKRVLVSGAGTGIGHGIACAFADAGADVVFHYSHSAEKARQAVAHYQQLGRRAQTIPADFRDLAAVRSLAQHAQEFMGGIDVLVNNAGITMAKPIEQVTPEQFETLYQVNVRAPYFLSQAVIPQMRQRGSGQIINITSVHAYEGMNEHSVYAGTRGAIVAFTRQLAVEMAPHGVRVNAIAPGWIEVENHYRVNPDLNVAEAAKTVPAGFIGQPRDIAAMAVFLASDHARYIIGQTLIIDGGTTSWMPFGEGYKSPIKGAWGKGYVPGV